MRVAARHHERSAPAAGTFLAVALLCAALGSGPARGDEDCDRARWPLAADRARLAAPDLMEVASGARLAPGGGEGGAVRLVLQPGAALAHPAGRAPAAGTGSGFLRLDVPEPGGVWQVTLDAAAWVDVFVDGRPLDPTAFTGVHACPGVRKSLRFALTPGPAILQISGAQVKAVSIAIIPVP